MSDSPRLGAKVRTLRRREGLTQVQLAEKMGISASYLNLIEHNRRPLTAPLLIKLATLFNLDLQSFAADDEARLVSELLEVFADGLFDDHDLKASDLREFAATTPQVARAVVRLYEAYRGVREAADTLAARVADGDEPPNGLDRDRIPSEEVHELLQRHTNHFPALEDAAERLWRDARLDPNDIYRSMTDYLERRHGIEVRVISVSDSRGVMRRFDETQKRLYLSEALTPNSRNFQVAHQIGLLVASDTLNLVVDEARLSSDESRKLARVALSNYFAGAVIMPYERFHEAAKAVRYDVEILGHRFNSSFEQICHRLTTLRRPGLEGVPFHMIRVDIAGNISKRFSGSGIRFARFSGACPKWNVHAAFQLPGQVRVQLSRMPDGTSYFCVARTVSRGHIGYHGTHNMQAVGLGCDVSYARELVYADGVDLDNTEAAVPIGVTCRLCERVDCTQRAIPPLHHPLKVDENTRGLSFYAPVVDR
ncbi:MAG: short-chain fatty acyl-CoA regulator family protein [Bradymonadia bacterium]